MQSALPSAVKRRDSGDGDERNPAGKNPSEPTAKKQEERVVRVFHALAYSSNDMLNSCFRR
jgi:hypothetical protein